VAQTAKRGEMAIGDPSVSERFWKRIGVELRVGPRARDRTYVDEQIDTYLLKQGQEFVD